MINRRQFLNKIGMLVAFIPFAGLVKGKKESNIRKFDGESCSNEYSINDLKVFAEFDSPIEHMQVDDKLLVLIRDKVFMIDSDGRRTEITFHI